ncbi:MAG: apolipoprotein N-acyltransferase [Gammaproteobacteria bacterium]|nr:apolipoprotein N-acyltransferase [Gammaproteobacteria bacterium]
MIWVSFISLFIGALLPLAFSPFDIYSMAFIIPAILLFVWKKASPKKAFITGWLFGLGFFGTGTSWIFISIHAFGNASTALAALITFLFVAVLAFYPATLGYVFQRYFSRYSDIKKCLLIYPALWVLWEYCRSEFFTGFPWLLLGCTQLTTPLKGLLPVIGTYGLSLIVTVISGALVLLATKQSRFTKIICFVIVFGLIGTGWVLENHAWTKPVGLPIKTSLIQGNIPQEVKWNPAYVMQNINIYKNLTFAHFSSELIVWPEGAFPVYAQDAEKFIHQLGQLAKKNNSNIIFGVPIQNGKNDYNGLLLIGDNQGQYLKRHLVPFGEYTPFYSVFGKAMSYFNIPMSAFSEGPRNQPELKINKIQISPFICYEIAFPIRVLSRAENSEFLITLSDDSWFGKSIALAQHLQMAQVRSLETGRYQLLSTNTGITAVISPFGDIIKGAPIDQRVVITEDVQPMTGETPLMVWRYYPVAGLIILMLLLGGL